MFRNSCLAVLCVTSCSGGRTFGAAGREPSPRQLPGNFAAVPGTGIHETGWPLEIMCAKDNAVMVFVPGGIFLSGLDDGQMRQVAKLKLRFDPTKPNSLTDAMTAKKTMLAATIALINDDKEGHTFDTLMRQTAEELRVRLVMDLLRQQGRVIPERELRQWESEGRTLSGLVTLSAVTQALDEELLEYLRTWNEVEDPVEREARSSAHEFLPAAKRRLGPFYIDKYEVTNRQYRLFIDESNSELHLPGIVNPGYDGFNLAPTGRKQIYYLWDDEQRNDDDQPVTCVSDKDVIVYAEWAGRSLPTRIHWQRAAVGDGRRLFPWGNEFDPDYCKCDVWDPEAPPINVDEDPGEHPLLDLMGLVLKDLQDLRRVSVPAKVGSFSKDRSPFGCFDMAGNVSEWVHFVDKDRYKLVGGNADTNVLEWLVSASILGSVEPQVGGFRTVLLLDGVE